MSLWLCLCRTVWRLCLHLLCCWPWDFFHWSIPFGKNRNCLSSLSLCIINPDTKHMLVGDCQNQTLDKRPLLLHYVCRFPINIYSSPSPQIFVTPSFLLLRQIVFDWHGTTTVAFFPSWFLLIFFPSIFWDLWLTENPADNIISTDFQRYLEKCVSRHIFSKSHHSFSSCLPSPLDISWAVMVKIHSTLSGYANRAILEWFPTSDFRQQETTFFFLQFFFYS